MVFYFNHWKKSPPHHFSSLSPPMLIHYPVWPQNSRFGVMSGQITCQSSSLWRVNWNHSQEWQKFFWNSCISVILQYFCHFNHLTILCVGESYTLCLMLRLFYIKLWCILSIIYQKIKRKGYQCVLYQRTRAEVLRGDISFHLQSAPQLKDTSAIYLPQQRESSCEERARISACEEREREREREREILCLKALLDDWSSAVVKNRLLQQLLHRLLSLACSIPPLSLSVLSLSHIYTHTSHCLFPIYCFSSCIFLFSFPSFSLLNPRKHGKTNPILHCSLFHQPQQQLLLSFLVSNTRFPFLLYPCSWYICFSSK